MKKRKFNLDDIEQLKQSAITKEAFNLEEECKDIFGRDYDVAMLRLIVLQGLSTNIKGLSDIITLDRFNLYELIMDNTPEEIIEYYKGKIQSITNE